MHKFDVGEIAWAIHVPTGNRYECRVIAQPMGKNDRYRIVVPGILNPKGKDEWLILEVNLRKKGYPDWNRLAGVYGKPKEDIARLHSIA